MRPTGETVLLIATAVFVIAWVVFIMILIFNTRFA